MGDDDFFYNTQRFFNEEVIKITHGHCKKRNFHYSKIHIKNITYKTIIITNNSSTELATET